MEHVIQYFNKQVQQDILGLRVKGAEGIARVLYCTLLGRRIVMLHGFVKKSMRTPPKELALAKLRMKEVKHENP